MPIFAARSKAAIFVLALAGGAAALPRPAHAQLAVVCPLCSNLFTQLIQDAREAAAYTTEVNQYTTQLRQYQLEIQNSALQPSQVWMNAQYDIAQINRIINAGTMLAGQTAAVTGRLQSLPQYTAQFGTLANITNQYQNWSNMSRNNIDTMHTALGLRYGQEANDANIVSAIEARGNSAGGQMQAIQAGVMAGAAAVDQLQKLNQIMTDETQLQTDEMAVEADRRAMGDQALANFLSPPDVQTAGHQRY